MNKYGKSNHARRTRRTRTKKGGPGRRGRLRTGGARALNVRVMLRLCPRRRGPTTTNSLVGEAS